MRRRRTSGAWQRLRTTLLCLAPVLALGACANLKDLEEDIFSDQGIFGNGGARSESAAGNPDDATAEAGSAEKAVTLARIAQPPVPRRKPEAGGRQGQQTAALGAADFDSQHLVAVDPLRQEVLRANPDPERFIGMGFADAIAVLGAPQEQRQEAPAKVWSYQSTDCDFNLFFFPGLEESVYRVLTYEVVDYRLKSKGDPDSKGLRVARALAGDGQIMSDARDGAPEAMASGQTVSAATPDAADPGDTLDDAQIIRRCLAQVIPTETLE